MVWSWLHHWLVVDGLRLIDRLRFVVNWSRLVSWSVGLIGRGLVGGGLDGLVGWNMGLIYWSWGMISRWWRVVGSRSMVRGVVEADTDTGHVTVTDERVVTLVRRPVSNGKSQQQQTSSDLKYNSCRSCSRSGV